MKRAATFLTLAALALAITLNLTGCGAIARIEEARADRANATARAAWADTEKVRIAENAHTERVMILSNERLALTAQANKPNGTDHNGGITARVDVGAGVGIGWPAMFILGGLALGVFGLIVWSDRQRRSDD